MIFKYILNLEVLNAEENCISTTEILVNYSKTDHFWGLFQKHLR